MKTAILILNWNAYHDTVTCLQSLLPNISADDYVFIIDNGSTDGSSEALQEYFRAGQQSLVICPAKNLEELFDPLQKHYLVINPGNLGFGAGNNVVLKRLLSLNSGFELAWLLNNDTVVKLQTLHHLKTSISQENNIAVSGSLIMNYPDTGTIQCSGVKHYRFFGVSKLVNKNLPYSQLDKSKALDFDYLNGASLLIKLSALEKTGYFDEAFFLYSEEYDLELRLQKAGYRLCLELDSLVYHKLGGGTRNKKYLFYYYYNTSAILLSKKHFSAFYTLCAVINLSAITFIRTFPSAKNLAWGLKGILKGLKN